MSSGLVKACKPNLVVQINNFPETYEYNGDLRVKFLANQNGRFSHLITVHGPLIWRTEVKQSFIEPWSEALMDAEKWASPFVSLIRQP